MKQVIFRTPILVLGLFALAMAAADFSGTWVFDRTKSDPMMGGPGGQAPPGDMSITLVITQTASELQLTRKMSMGGEERSSEQKFTLDGKESTTTAMMGRGELVAKASWNGDVLIIEGTQKTQRGEMPVKYEYALSDGGKTLTVTSTMRERTMKQVYNKQ
jgi:hypothetical protein